MRVTEVCGIWINNGYAGRVNTRIESQSGEVVYITDVGGVIQSSAVDITLYEDDNSFKRPISACIIRELMLPIAKAGGIQDWDHWKIKKFGEMLISVLPNGITVKLESERD